MMNVRKIKLKEYTLNSEINLNELKEAMIRYYYPKISEEALIENMKRELIVTSIKNGYGMIYTTVFSVNGSPPKGECVLLHTSGEELLGTLIFIGNGRNLKLIREIAIIN